MKTLLSFNEAVNFDVDNWNIQQEVDMFNNVLSQWNMLKKSINNKLRDGEKLNIDGKEWDVKIETYNSGKYVWIRNSENVLFEFKIKKNKITPNISYDSIIGNRIIYVYRDDNDSTIRIKYGKIPTNVDLFEDNTEMYITLDRKNGPALVHLNFKNLNKSTYEFYVNGKLIPKSKIKNLPFHQNKIANRDIDNVVQEIEEYLKAFKFSNKFKYYTSDHCTYVKKNTEEKGGYGHKPSTNWQNEIIVGLRIMKIDDDDSKYINVEDLSKILKEISDIAKKHKYICLPYGRSLDYAIKLTKVDNANKIEHSSKEFFE